MHLRETTAASLSEAAVNNNGQTLLRLIAPGWSKNGRYYSESVLKKAVGSSVFPSGTRTYLDHPSKSDEIDRPERSVRDLVGSLQENAYYDANGPAGPGLYSRATVRDDYQPLVNDLAESIGMSIRADGTGHQGEAEGRTGMIVDSIEAADSVDYVTKPAAGGKVVQLIESVQSPEREEHVEANLTADMARYAEAMRAAGQTERAETLQEARNIGQWLEARIHSVFTSIADDMYGDGRLTRDERLALSGAIGDALTAFTSRAEADAPAVFERDLFQDPEPEATEMSESTQTGTSTESSTEASPTPTAPESVPADDAETAADESAPIEAQESTSEEGDMTGTPGAETAPLSTFRRQIESELDNERHARALSEGRERARQLLGQALSEAPITPSRQQRITEALLADIPLTNDRKLDEPKLLEAAQRELEQAEMEVAETLSAAGFGKPRDLGQVQESLGGIAQTEHYEQRRIERYKRHGMSESAAKIAAKGRA